MHPFQRLIYALLLCLCALPVSATPSVVYAGPIANSTGSAVTYQGPDGTRIHIWPDAGDRRSISNGPGGSVVVRDRVPMTTSRGAITVTSRSAVSASSIARGAAIAGRALPAAGIAIGVGSLIWDLMEDARVKPDGAGGLLYDPGVPESEFTGACWMGPAGECYGSPHGAASAYLRKAERDDPGNGYELSYVVITGTLSALYYYKIHTGGGNFINSGPGGVQAVIKNQRGCAPPPATTGTKGSDGKCGTGVYGPVSEQGAADAMEKGVSGTSDRVPLVNDILGRPGGAVDITPGSQTTSGPSSQTGTPPAPIVTTGPGGPVTTTESPGIAIRYRGREVEWEPQQVTTRRPGPNPGDPEETTVTDAPDEPSSDPQSGVTPDYCLSNPKRAGCSELGEVEPPEWNPDEKPIELRAESPWGSDNASCPPPRTLVIGGKQYLWEWTLVCDFFSGVRFAVIASAWIAAVMIFIGARSDT